MYVSLQLDIVMFVCTVRYCDVYVSVQLDIVMFMSVQLDIVMCMCVYIWIL